MAADRDHLGQIRAHAFGYVPEALVQLLEAASSGTADPAALANRFAAEATDPRHWESIRPADITVHTPLSHSGILMDDAARAADAEARRDAHAVLGGEARWLLPALQHAGAELFVAPGVFAYMLPGERAAHQLPDFGDRICPAAEARTVVPARERNPDRWKGRETLPLGVITFHRFDRPGRRVTDLIDDAGVRAADLALTHLACEAVSVCGLLPLFRDAPATVIVLPGRLFYSLGAAPLPMVEIPAGWAGFAAGAH